MDQYQSKGKLLTNFEGHRSIQIILKRDWSSHECPWKFACTNGSQISESSGLHWHLAFGVPMQLKFFLKIEAALMVRTA